jgi:hypothetical protein
MADSVMVQPIEVIDLLCKIVVAEFYLCKNMRTP